MTQKEDDIKFECKEDEQINKLAIELTASNRNTQQFIEIKKGVESAA